MKPLVLWCRWHQATLRLHGRSPKEVWGELAYSAHSDRFRFALASNQLTIITVETGDEQTLLLDEMGIEISS